MVTGALDWPELPVSPPNPPPPNNCDNPSKPCACDEPGNMKQNRRSAVALTNVLNRVILIWFEQRDVVSSNQKDETPPRGLQENRESVAANLRRIPDALIFELAWLMLRGELDPKFNWSEN